MRFTFTSCASILALAAGPSIAWAGSIDPPESAVEEHDAGIPPISSTGLRGAERALWHDVQQAPITNAPTAAPTAAPTNAPTKPITKPAKISADRTVVPAGQPVLPTDTVLVPPSADGPVVAPITAYSWRQSKLKHFLNGAFELPMYQNHTLSRDTDEFWNYLVDELLLSRVNAVMLHGRGCYVKDAPLQVERGYGTIDAAASQYYRGSGELCPRYLTRFRDAVIRADARHVIKIGMFDPMDHYQGDIEKAYGYKPLTFDFANPAHYQYFFDHNVKVLFDIFPQDMWYRDSRGRPVISTWTLQSERFSNGEGNISTMLQWIKGRFEQEYGVEPAIIIQGAWLKRDSTLTTTPDLVEGVHNWFSPRKGFLHSQTEFNDKKWGVIGPGYRKVSGNTFHEANEPGCGTICREVPRRGGQTLIDGFEANKDSELILLEGWTNMGENNGYYRSENPAWKYPCQYINLVRRYADPTPETIRFQAEGADRFHDTTPGNLGRSYADRALDVAALKDGSGWYVGWVEPGEWIEYQDVTLGCGTYRFTARVATWSEGRSLRLALPRLDSVGLPNTNNNFELVHLGETTLGTGNYNLKVIFESKGVNLDWFFLKKVNDKC